jgi:hypothetical protein
VLAPPGSPKKKKKKNDPKIRMPVPDLGSMNPGHATLQMNLRPGPAQTPQDPPLHVEFLSDLFVLHQVLLYCFKHQAEVIAGLFCEVTQGAPNQWFLGDSGSILAGLCTMHQWQLVGPVLILFCLCVFYVCKPVSVCFCVSLCVCVYVCVCMCVFVFMCVCVCVCM